MKVTYARVMFVLAVLLGLGVQVYAHHGNQFLTTAREMNAAEVQMGQLGKDKAQNAHVKSFAESMIKDHTEGFDKIQGLLDARTKAGVPGTKNARSETNTTATMHAADMQVNQAHKQAWNHLKTLSGAQFDRTFIDAMVRDHRAAIAAFEAASHAHGANQTSSNQGNKKTTTNTVRSKPDARGTDKWSRSEYARDLDVAEFASGTLPTLRRHLEEAQNIQKELGGSTTNQR